MNFAQKAAAWVVQKLGLTDAASWRYYQQNTYAGKSVSVDSALQLATVWACVRLISETLATLPLFLYVRGPDGQRDLAFNHPLYGILHDQPNANMTAVEFWEAVVSQLCLWGNAYCLKTYSGATLISLDPLRPDLMSVSTNANGVLIYAYSDPRGRKEYDEGQIFHLKGFGVDGLMGLSPVSYARNSFGSAMAADEASGKVFANGMRVGGALTSTAILSPVQRKEVKESIAAQLAGTANTGKLMVLEGGFTYAPLSINPDDAQMLETRSFNIEEICRWFRTPPSMIGHGTAVSNWGTGIEQQMLGFLMFALRPYLTRIEQGIKKSLLTPTERLKYFAEFSLEGLMRADSAGRAALYSSAAQNGWLTRNEIRSLENRPRVEGGDDLTVQSNLLPLDLLGRQPPAQVPGF